MIRFLHSLVTVLHFFCIWKKPKALWTEAVVRRCSVKKLFLKILQSSHSAGNFVKRKSSRVYRLVRSNFINESASWLLKNTKKWGWQILAVWKGFCWRHKCCDQQKMKVKKIQTQLYHSIEDKKPCKNHVKTITWKCHVFKMYTFN